MAIYFIENILLILQKEWKNMFIGGCQNITLGYARDICTNGYNNVATALDQQTCKELRMVGT